MLLYFDENHRKGKINAENRLVWVNGPNWENIKKSEKELSKDYDANEDKLPKKFTSAIAVLEAKINKPKKEGVIASLRGKIGRAFGENPKNEEKKLRKCKTEYKRLNEDIEMEMNKEVLESEIKKIKDILRIPEAENEIKNIEGRINYLEIKSKDDATEGKIKKLNEKRGKLEKELEVLKSKTKRVASDEVYKYAEKLEVLERNMFFYKEAEKDWKREKKKEIKKANQSVYDQLGGGEVSGYRPEELFEFEMDSLNKKELVKERAEELKFENALRESKRYENIRTKLSGIDVDTDKVNEYREIGSRLKKMKIKDENGKEIKIKDINEAVKITQTFKRQKLEGKVSKWIEKAHNEIEKEFKEVSFEVFNYEKLEEDYRQKEKNTENIIADTFLRLKKESEEVELKLKKLEKLGDFNDQDVIGILESDLGNFLDEKLVKKLKVNNEQLGVANNILTTMSLEQDKIMELQAEENWRKLSGSEKMSKEEKSEWIKEEIKNEKAIKRLYDENNYRLKVLRTSEKIKGASSSRIKMAREGIVFEKDIKNEKDPNKKKYKQKIYNQRLKEERERIEIENSATLSDRLNYENKSEINNVLLEAHFIKTETSKKYLQKKVDKIRGKYESNKDLLQETKTGRKAVKIWSMFLTK